MKNLMLFIVFIFVSGSSHAQNKEYEIAFYTKKSCAKPEAIQSLEPRIGNKSVWFEVNFKGPLMWRYQAEKLRDQKLKEIRETFCEGYQERPTTEFTNETCETFVNGSGWSGGEYLAPAWSLHNEYRPNELPADYHREKMAVDISTVSCSHKLKCLVSEHEYYAFLGSEKRVNGPMIPRHCLN